MSAQEPNYVKEVFLSQWNLAFVGIMIFLMLVVNFIGFGALLLGGEVLAFLLAQMPIVQHYLRLRSQIEDKENVKEKEQEIYKNLPPQYQQDFDSVVSICTEIEEKWKLQGNADNYLLKDLISKLGTFRFEYARMLQAHYLTSSRDVNRLSNRLQNELQQNENALQNEKSDKVRDVLAQNIRVIKQRLQRTTQMNDLVRLLAARLSVVKNSLNLLYDEVYTVADPSNVSSAVDNLIITLNVDEELKATYEDVLSNPKTETNSLNDAQNQQANNARRQSNLRRIK
jgi:hypothetical protein